MSLIRCHELLLLICCEEVHNGAQLSVNPSLRQNLARAALKGSGNMQLLSVMRSKSGDINYIRFPGLSFPFLYARRRRDAEG